MQVWCEAKAAVSDIDEIGEWEVARGEEMRERALAKYKDGDQIQRKSYIRRHEVIFTVRTVNHKRELRLNYLKVM